MVVSLTAHLSPLAAQTPAAALARAVEADVIGAHLALLADDALEGRGTGQRGGEIAAKYLAAQFARLGLEPAGDDGTYYQRIPLRRAHGTTRAPGRRRLARAGDRFRGVCGRARLGGHA